MFARIKSNFDEYVQNKDWYWYVPFWLFGLYLFFKLLDFKLGQTAPSFFIAIAQSFNFVLHEMAHLLTGFLPPLITASAGSSSELLLGLSLIVTAFLVRSYFASLFCFLWFMLATQATADYMADARSQNLALVSFGGGDPIHDWNFVFTKLGVLQHDKLIAGMVRGYGIAAGVFGLLLSAWLIIRIMQSKAAIAHKAEVGEIMNKFAGKSPEARDPDKPFLDSELYPSAEKGALAEHKAPESNTPNSHK
jgi:hypothetical protein